jgi:hypothetical protein
MAFRLRQARTVQGATLAVVERAEAGAEQLYQHPQPEARAAQEVEVAALVAVGGVDAIPVLAASGGLAVRGWFMF